VKHFESLMPTVVRNAPCAGEPVSKTLHLYGGTQHATMPEKQNQRNCRSQSSEEEKERKKDILTSSETEVGPRGRRYTVGCAPNQAESESL
jgi:hypothetical protein